MSDTEVLSATEELTLTIAKTYSSDYYPGMDNPGSGRDQDIQARVAPHFKQVMNVNRKQQVVVLVPHTQSVNKL